ncbi:AQP9 protein, partial [Polypterus senegalus]
MRSGRCEIGTDLFPSAWDSPPEDAIAGPETIFGCGAVAQVTTSYDTKGQFLSINLAFAIGITFGVHIAHGISGAHLNPAVSLAFCLLGRFQWSKLPFYVLSQIIGAYLGAATVFAQYYDAIMSYGGGNLTVTGPTATAYIFATYPAAYLTTANGFVDQVVGTAALLLCLMALVDTRNSPAPKGLEPALVGMIVLVIGIAMGSNCGYAINPARDLGPRLFTYTAGWGLDVFTAGNYWCWVPLVAPLVGAILGCIIYLLFIEIHHSREEDEKQTNERGKTEYDIDLDEWKPNKRNLTTLTASDKVHIINNSFQEGQSENSDWKNSSCNEECIVNRF